VRLSLAGEYYKDYESRVMELKQEINELLKKSGEALQYANTIPGDRNDEKIS
jgi:hypothetical protein